MIAFVSGLFSIFFGSVWAQVVAFVADRSEHGGMQLALGVRQLSGETLFLVGSCGLVAVWVGLMANSYYTAAVYVGKAALREQLVKLFRNFVVLLCVSLVLFAVPYFMGMPGSVALHAVLLPVIWFGVVTYYSYLFIERG